MLSNNIYLTNSNTINKNAIYLMHGGDPPCNIRTCPSECRGKTDRLGNRPWGSGECIANICKCKPKN
jgi:hypothetical protein